ncbi:histone chaperone ASF1-like [Lytechinus variegatus]|uniref:histone chaperone ASF1-like n=1 Tax=Lytechinus variegatus TaxID=7654 RepID=UPI001BB2715F|nr:histone chaperone ASF1-like [Lytechinus variegatus]
MSPFPVMTLVITTLLVLSSKVCTACKCIQIADESKICLSDFAISGSLLETNSISGMNSSRDDLIDYRVSVGTVHRSSRTLPSEMTIVTATHTCGFTDLQTNRTYFIAGQIQDGKYRINRCSSVVAKYGPDNVPYRYSVVKVNVNVTCPIEEEEEEQEQEHDQEEVEEEEEEEEEERNEEKEERDGDNSAVLPTSNFGLLAFFVLFAGILMKF